MMIENTQCKDGNIEINPDKISCSSIYEGCEFDEKYNIDWDALEITEELALQIGMEGNAGLPTRKHTRDFNDEGDLDEEENIKFMRFGSLGRIIIFSRTASTPSISLNGQLPFPFESAPSDVQRCEMIKFTSTKFMNAFNFGDLGR